MGRLKGRFVEASAIDEACRREMYALFERYYAHTRYDRFCADMARKDHVLILRDTEGRVGGFSTFQRTRLTIGSEVHQVLFSGDTVVDEPHWGDRSLSLGFARYVAWCLSQHPLTPLWWVLITKGYKTYLLMANNFPDHWPRHDAETPRERRTLMDAIGRELFGDEYHPESGLVVHHEPVGQLRDGIADIHEGLRRNPRVAFFADKNPGWAEGTELLCVARVNWAIPINYVRKLLRLAWRTGSSRREALS